MKSLHSAAGDRISARWLLMLALALVVGNVAGCAAFHPIRGVPAPYVPAEYLGPSRSGKRTIDLSLLVQTQPDQYRVAAEDVLSIYIPGVLGSLNVEENRQIGETPPINISTNPSDPPTIGYPITVRDDGTISLPYIDPINVHGMTLPEIETAIRAAYTKQSNVLNGERDRVLVSLQRRREYRVIVVRQETSSELTQGAQAGTLNVGNSKRGTARIVRLPAYENDVLHALANSETGNDGLPGLDAKNTIYIIRRKKEEAAIDALPLPPSDTAPPSEQSVAPPAVQPREVPPMPFPVRTPTAPVVVSPVADRPLGISPPAQRPDGNTGSSAPIEPQIPPADSFASEQVPQMQPPPLLDTPAKPPVAPATPLRPVQPWPAPAQPPKSIQRTSADGSPVTWPVMRGQSPAEVSWGHSPMASLAFEPPAQITTEHAVTASPAGHDPSWQDAISNLDPTVENPNVVKIPIRLAEGEYPTFTEQDIILEDGDIVFIESRETEVFYTGGLLGGGQYTLPRDYDLRVLEAISIAQSPQNSIQGTGRAIGGVSALNQDVTISASHVVILRSLPNGTRIPIEVDLYKAVRRPQENILIQPGDLVILQYTKVEAVAAFIERHLLEGAILGLATAQLTNND